MEKTDEQTRKAAFRALMMVMISPEYKSKKHSEENQHKLLDKLYSRNGLILSMTCGACPEQYDVHLNNELVGYIRLRHGTLSVEYTDFFGISTVILVTEDVEGDGCFMGHERLRFMAIILRLLLLNLEIDGRL